MAKGIRIANTPEGQNPWTSAHRAKKFVACGYATWVKPGVEIAMVTTAHQVVSAQEAFRITQYDVASSTGLATLQQVANLPCVGPMRMFWKRTVSRPTVQ